MNTNDRCAHQVAAHLRAIALMLPNLEPHQVRAYLPGLQPPLVGEYCAMLVKKAETLEATAPFEPVPAEDKAELFNMLADELSDSTSQDHAERETDTWTEADWRAEWDEFVEEKAQAEAEGW